MNRPAEQHSACFFNLHDMSLGLRRVLAAGVEARIFVGDAAMLSVVRLAPDARAPIHSHSEEQWGLLLEGGGVRIQGEAEVTVKQGDFWLTPAGTSHGFRASSEGALILDVFSPPREDYRASGAGLARPPEQ